VKSTNEIILYCLKIGKTQNQGVALFRTKVVVVGYETVGKTSLVERLFPFKSKGIVEVDHVRVGFIELSWRELIVHWENHEKHPSIINLADIESWECGEKAGGVIFLRQLKSGNQHLLLLSDREERALLLARLKRITGDERTVGIAFQRVDIPMPTEHDTRILQLRVCDFAGQYSYYNNHHYFLSARSVFLVVYKTTAPPSSSQGVDGLKFWLKSLSVHLAKPNFGGGDSGSGSLYSIFIVGTHADKLEPPHSTEMSFLERRKRIETLLAELHIALPYEYVEVSSSSRYGVTELKRKIILSAEGHAYMGERVPSSYIDVEQLVTQMRTEIALEKIPVAEVNLDFFPRLFRERAVSVEDGKRALSLLHDWGECIYFGGLEPLSNYVVLDPSFLSQQVMSRLFQPLAVKKYITAEGILPHSVLGDIWGRKENDIKFLMSLLENFEVCFELSEKDGGTQEGFFNRRSVVTSCLPGAPPPSFASLWEEAWSW